MLKINNVKISEDQPPYIIAELSGNHNGSLERAKLSIQMAKQYGASAIKLQTYTADGMTIDLDAPDFVVNRGLWQGYKLYDLYNEAHTPFEWHQELFLYARNLGITVFSTPFDEGGLELLEELSCPAYKIASFELVDTTLIREVAKTGKPMLMSTGMASFDDIGNAVESAKSGGCTAMLLFHCISSYPTPVENSNLKKILDLKREFNLPIGLSDHTIGSIAAITAVGLGACAFEKHFTISRADKGPDSEFSMEPNELRTLVNDLRSAWLSLGNGGFAASKHELENLVFRRSLYFTEDIELGGAITKDNMRRIRPGFGLHPKHYEEILGKTVKVNVKRGDRVTWEAIDPDVYT